MVKFKNLVLSIFRNEKSALELMWAISGCCSGSSGTSLHPPLIIRVDKCHFFGIKKSGTSSKQFQPKLFVNNELIPPVKQGQYFEYLGRNFDYKITNNKHKDDLLSDTKDKTKNVDKLPLHPKNTMLIYPTLSKLSWNLAIADIDMTWIKQFLDSIVNQ